MLSTRRLAFFLSVVGLAVLAAQLIQGSSAGAASPYQVVPGWGQLAPPLKWGEVPNVAIDPKGTVFVFTRSEPPVVELNAEGKVLKTWGQGMFVWPHGIRFDRDGNLWITDGRAANGNGQMVYKLSSDGSKILMTLGTKGVSGDGPNEFNGVTDVAIAPNGDIFVSDGHVNSRIVKFTQDGKFIKTWGKKGTGPGEFNLPHSLAFDSRGRLLVADRSNKRIQLFDQEGNFLEEWRQFGEASGIFIMPDDTLYVSDWQDKKAIFIGSAKDGSIKETIQGLTLAEGLSVDKQGNIYAAETLPGRIGELVTGSNVRKLVRN
ncbi:MAG TPA: peptidyl-alpha-hydroxyglycine alpha-amidating lyase family protein [Vicinamibacterales bacterium]|jgi:sugar lactone lactonase YvrE|nr:peptidyl-alpha-hydroxyglycine alpha-amidating lyase family protein [Vicinamibacterales bacterium]